MNTIVLIMGKAQEVALGLRSIESILTEELKKRMPAYISSLLCAFTLHLSICPSIMELKLDHCRGPSFLQLCGNVAIVLPSQNAGYIHFRSDKAPKTSTGSQEVLHATRRLL